MAFVNTSLTGGTFRPNVVVLMRQSAPERPAESLLFKTRHFSQREAQRTKQWSSATGFSPVARTMNKDMWLSKRSVILSTVPLLPVTGSLPSRTTKVEGETRSAALEGIFYWPATTAATSSHTRLSFSKGLDWCHPLISAQV